MTTDNINHPAIYYVIQGRKLENDSTYIEHTFMDINPEIARQRAFDYLEYYVQLLQQGKQLFFRENEKLVKNEVSLNDIQNATVSFAENNVGIDGIAMYMVVKEPILYMNILDKKEDRFLIYAIKNLSESDIETTKKSLIREYGYYKYMQIDTSKTEDEVQLISKSQKKGFGQNLVYTTLQTPFEFRFADINTKSKQIFRNNINQELKNINLQKSAFITDLDYHNIRIQIASLFNSKGGNVFLCNFNKGIIQPFFDNKSIASITTLIKKEIFSYFPNHKYFLQIHFVRINNVLVPIIEVKIFYNKPCFYDNDIDNSFYYRTEKGLKIISKTEDIVSYITENIVNNKKALNDLLDSL